MNTRDEVLYHAKIHPEQYSNTLNDGQINQLWSSIHYVCSTSVDLLGDADEFPTDWLFKYRWNKGKKDVPQKLPNGERITFITVGGRTSAVVPSVQKKTGPVAKDVNPEDLENGSNGGGKGVAAAGKRKRAAVKKEESDAEDVEDEVQPKKPAPKKRGLKAKQEDSGDEEIAQKGARGKPKAMGKTEKKAGEGTSEDVSTGRRRSARIAK
jgi:formamidopyrimidine-DNA glycosylase